MGNRERSIQTIFQSLLVFQNDCKKFKKNKRSMNFLQSITLSGSLILTEPKDIKKTKLKWKEPKCLLLDIDITLIRQYFKHIEYDIHKPIVRSNFMFLNNPVFGGR